jgi:hypothetical protein
MNHRPSTVTALLMATTFAAQTTAAGTQLLCRRYEIGAEPSLPWTASGEWG